MKGPKGLVGFLLISLVLAACGSTNANGTAAPQAFLNPEEVRTEMSQAQSVTPLPPGATWRPIYVNPDAQHETGSGENMVQFQAMCQWYGYWAAAISSGDTAKMAVADAAVAKFPTWHTYASSDTSFRQFLDQIAQRARLGDGSGLQQMIKNNCG